MQQSCTYGSVRGAAGDRRPYRDEAIFLTPTKASMDRVIERRSSGETCRAGRS